MDKAGLFTALAVLLLLAWAPSSHAATLEESLDQAHAKIKTGEHREVSRALDMAKTAAAEAEGVVQHDQLARYWFYKGMATHGRKRSKVFMSHWRRTLVVDNEFEWDRSLSEDLNARRLFEALRREVQQAGEIDPRVPEKTGLAQLYINGTRVTEDARVTKGEHLAQVQCPEGAVRGKWVDFSRGSLDWFGLCPNPVDTSVVLADVFGEAEFGGMGIDFDEEPLPEAPPAPVEPVAQPESGDGVADADADVEKEPATSVEPPPKKRTSGSAGAWMTPRNLSMMGGGALVAAGVAVNFVMVEPAWSRIEDARSAPESIDRREADALSSDFDRGRSIALGLMATGLVVGTTGYVLLDGTVKPALGPAKVGLQFQF